MTPAHYNDLAASLNHGWQLLTRGASDRRSPLHLLTLATARDGGADARLLVLRAASQAAATLRFHTDARSHKAALIGDNMPVTLLGYHPGENVQLRLSGVARIDRESPERLAAWERTSLYGRRCYLGAQGPGSAADAPTSGLPAELEGAEPSAERTQAGLAHFALLWVEVRRLEWLFLAHHGHRRAVFEAENGWAGRWLVP